MTFTPEIDAALDEIAKERGISRDEAINLIIQDWLITQGVLPPAALDSDED